MQLPPAENKVNWTTAIALLTFIITIGGLVYAWGEFNAGVKDLREDVAALAETLNAQHSRYVSEHAEYHKARGQEASALNARLDERIKSLEQDNRRLDNLDYRMTVREQDAANQNKISEETRRELSQLTGDIRLIREIVTRLDPGPQPQGRRP